MSCTLVSSTKFNVSQCSWSWPFTGRMQASFPLKQIIGSRWLRCHFSPLKDIICKLRYHRQCFMEKWPNYFNYHKTCSFITSDRRQSKKRLWTINERWSQITIKLFFNCHLSPVGLVMAIKNSVSNYFGIRLLIVFLIAAYPVWFHCMFHDATVDILFGTACAWKEGI